MTDVSTWVRCFTLYMALAKKELGMVPSMVAHLHTALQLQKWAPRARSHTSPTGARLGQEGDVVFTPLRLLVVRMYNNTCYGLCWMNCYISSCICLRNVLL
jgi:hypothetical protein